MGFASRCTLGILQAALLCTAAAAGPTASGIVTLVVKHNGKVEPAPDIINVSFDGQSRTLVVRAGRFQVPPEVLRSEKVTVSMVIGQELICIPDIRGGQFGIEDWTLMLEDKRFPDEFQYRARGAAARRACGVIFQSRNSEGTTYLVWHCRRPLARGSR